MSRNNIIDPTFKPHGNVDPSFKQRKISSSIVDPAFHSQSRAIIDPLFRPRSRGIIDPSFKKREHFGQDTDYLRIILIIAVCYYAYNRFIKN